MDVKSYLQTKLQTCASYSLTDADKQFLDEHSIEEYIYKVITSKKFRKWSIPEGVQQRIKEAVHLNVSRNKPVQFVSSFGGYKLWRLPTSPEVDWAEFFAIAHYVNFIAPILPAYAPGAEFTFSSDDIIVSRLNNVDTRYTQAYIASFHTLLNYFRQYTPGNLKVELRRIGDVYDRKDFEADLAEKLKEIKEAAADWDEIRWQKMLKSSTLNIKFDGVEDWTGLSEHEKMQKIELGAICHDAYCALPGRLAFVRGRDKVVVFTSPTSSAVAVGTTKTSITKFWTGIGIIEKEGEHFRERILSPEQWASFKNEKHEVIDIQMIDLHNFKHISLYSQRFHPFQ